MKKRYIVWIAAVLMIGVLLTGCSGRLMDAVESSVEKTGLTEPTRRMLDGLLQDDFDTCFSLLCDQITQTQFRAAYDQIRQVLPPVDAYTLTPANYNFRTANGITVNQVRYVMEAGELTFYVDVSSTSDMEGFTGFYITPYVAVTKTGTVETMKGANAAQWAVLLIAALEAGFIIWMVIDCIRRKMSKKVLWILLILAGNLLTSFSFAEGSIRLNFNVGIFLGYTSFVRYSTGEWMLQLLVPIGAIVYFARRKNLKPKSDQTAVRESGAQDLPWENAPYVQEAPGAEQQMPETDKQV